MGNAAEKGILFDTGLLLNLIVSPMCNAISFIFWIISKNLYTTPGHMVFLIQYYCLIRKTCFSCVLDRMPGHLLLCVHCTLKDRFVADTKSFSESSKKMILMLFSVYAFVWILVLCVTVISVCRNTLWGDCVFVNSAGTLHVGDEIREINGISVAN